MPACSVPGCEKLSQGAGLCPGHYQRERRGQPLGPLGVHGKRIDVSPEVDVMVRFPRQLFAALAAAAKRRGISISELAVVALNKHATNLKAA